MLHTDDLWEDVDGAVVLRELTNQPGLRQFWCVEVPLNIQLFHVDILCEFGTEAVWSRFIFDNIRRVIPILRGNRPGCVQLSMQTRRRDYVGYKILPIRKVISGTITSGFENFAFICSNGVRYYESTADLSVGEFSNEHVVWTSSPRVP